MKPIEETHPSLKDCQRYIDNAEWNTADEPCILNEDVQEHTIDKAVLREMLNNWNCHNEEIRKTVNTLKFKLELEEKDD